jgi:hypothetical protein
LRILKQEVFIKIYHNFERYNSKKAKPLQVTKSIKFVALNNLLSYEFLGL